MSTETSRGPGRPRANCDSEEPLVGLDVRVSIETGAAIEAAAERTGIPTAAIIREAVAKHLELDVSEPMMLVMGKVRHIVRAALAADVKQEVEAEATRRKGSAAGVVREAIEEWLAAHDQAAGTTTSP